MSPQEESEQKLHDTKTSKQEIQMKSIQVNDRTVLARTNESVLKRKQYSHLLSPMDIIHLQCKHTRLKQDRHR